MKNKTAKKLMEGMPIGVTDAVRLVMEMAEEIGERYEVREGMMQRLRQVIREGVKAVRNAELTESFETTAWASVEARAGRRPTTRRDLRCFVRRMLRVQGLAERPLRQINAQECRRILLSSFGRSESSYRKGRAILHSIFAFGLRRGWCAVNPVDSIECPIVRERHIEPLTLQEIDRLHEAAKLPEHAPMRLSLQLMLYCGLRPHEVQRLRPDDIRWREREVVIRPAVSKTGGGRVVPLRRIMLKNRGTIPGNWSVRWRALRKAAGFTRWQADVCRHSFASYHAACYKKLSVLQWEMGHRNLQLLSTRYISPVSCSVAKKYWQRANQ